ncbi:RING-H2 finger protein ATL56-like [Iris pallida]|uniref:RING-H2 finger protein ATL56-like n=1 Tax=Iris pallida TaxID=29817 RepID=A0AAX6FN46_IRIPA|nr:RING-H2 finger protein ATL56-like [Iris pallida]KAJ6817759.1 RING-H2 finger protein ATL56-like [Iris pallida]
MRTRLLWIAVQIMVLAIVISVVLLVVGVGVLVLIRAWTPEIFSRGRSSDRDADAGEGEYSHGGLSSDDLEKLPCYDYAPKDSTENHSPAECALCLEAFRDGDKCRLLPACRHSFHAACVDSWLSKSSVCPLCRTICARQSVGKGAGTVSVAADPGSVSE